MSTFIRLFDYDSSFEKEQGFFKIEKRFESKQEDFGKIPGSPIAYWASESVINVFSKHQQIYKCSISEGQNITAGNDKYLRLWWEVNRKKVEPAGKWSFYSKGGSYRKWFGNLDYVVDWSDDARKHYHSHSSARIIPKYLRFREGITWTLITSANKSFRYLPSYATFDKGGSSIFFNESIDLKKCLLFFNTKISAYLTKLFNATLNLQVDDVRKLPLSPSLIVLNNAIFEGLIGNSKSDWDSHETSWDFASSPLLHPDYHQSTLKTIYTNLHAHWNEMTLEVQQLEEENNRIFIQAYGLQNELTPEVPLSEITLTCNPHYRYSGNKGIKNLEILLFTDTMKEFISYAIGCMFGRYSPDKEGFILVNQEETLTDFKEKIPNPSFEPDDDNIIPVLDDEYFEDDIITHFKEFLKTTFGDNSLYENLEFIAEALGKRSSENSEDTIRRYFLNDFYSDHCKMYKKRPIYWLFTSGPEKAFNALIYIHRYNKETLAKMRIGYLIKFEEKLEAKKATLKTDSSNPKIKQKALNEQTKINKKLDEIRKYDEKLKHLADQYIEIDLDDGVKSNYKLFEEITAKI